jgi:tetratricopeptide (TPR) repeat protein
LSRGERNGIADCNKGIDLEPKPAPYDSLGLVHLKLGNYDQAIANYDAALKIDPNYASALYGRGTAKLKKGDNSGGNSDIASAKAIQSNIADRFVAFGVK